MKPDQERLSEQAYIEAHEQGWRDAEEFHDVKLKSTPQRYYHDLEQKNAELARQLTEAERRIDNQRLALDKFQRKYNTVKSQLRRALDTGGSEESSEPKLTRIRVIERRP